MTRLILADDHQLFLDGLQFMLKDTTEFEIVAAVNSGEAVLNLLETASVDLVTLDIQFKGMTGIETARKIKNQYPETRILMISMLAHLSHIKQLLTIGVDGYILKDSGKEAFLTALEKITNGGKYYSEEVTHILTTSFAGSSNVKPTGLNRISLSKREMEVLQFVAKGYTTAQIADQLFVAPSTIVSHRKSIMLKLEVKNVAEMIRYSTEMGLLE